MLWMQRLNDQQINTIDILSLFSVFLQIIGYKNDMDQSSNDEIMKELQEVDRKYLQKILDNQQLIIDKITKMVEDSTR